MALRNPAYRLTFRSPAGGPDALPATGGKVIDSTTKPEASILTRLSVELGMGGGCDRATFEMGQVGSFRPATGHQVDLDLGYADDGGFERVMSSGMIVDEGPDLVERRLVAHGPAAKLLATRINKTFENRNAGQIVRELAQAADVEVAAADSGIDFPVYVVDGRRNAYQHILDLAELCGFDRYIDRDGKLVFTFFTGGRTAHVLEHGKHILQVEMSRRPPSASQVVAWGESGTNGGDGSTFWLTKDFEPFTGTSGTGAPAALLEKSALRTRRAAVQAAMSRLTELKRRSVTGTVYLVGTPQVRLGDSIFLRGVPEEGFDGTYQVRALTHDLSKIGGFTTRIDFRSIEQ